MRIAVVSIPSGDAARLSRHRDALVRGFGSSGHSADAVDSRSEVRLSLYDFIAILSEPSGIGSKLPPRVSELLAGSGTLVGKRSMAVLCKRGLASTKALARLMSAMEAEGMLVTCGEIVTRPEDALRAAREAPVERA